MPKTKLRVSWTEVIPRSTDVELDLDEDDLEDVEAGYGSTDEMWREAVREVAGNVEMLHDQVDFIEVLEVADEQG